MTTLPTNRVERIIEAHPWVPEDTVHCLLVYAYKRVTSDPTVGGSFDAQQTYLENYTDIVCRMTEHDLKNEIAKVSEWFPDGFDLSDLAEDEEDEDE